MPSCQVRVSSNLVQRRASSPSGVAAVGAGTRCPVTGAARAVDGGFRRTAPHTAILAGGPYDGLENAYGWGSHYGFCDDWGALSYPYNFWRGPSRGWGNP